MALYFPDLKDYPQTFGAEDRRKANSHSLDHDSIYQEWETRELSVGSSLFFPSSLVYRLVTTKDGRKGIDVCGYRLDSKWSDWSEKIKISPVRSEDDRLDILVKILETLKTEGKNVTFAKFWE